MTGPQSMVAKAHSVSTGSEVHEGVPFAELWMGLHPSGPNFVDSEPIEKFLARNEHLFVGGLPFLFKVLSIRKALSIQAHPDKMLATKLFHEFPQIYKDPNHKPELAIALGDFEALCGFQPLTDIVRHLQSYPEFDLIFDSSTLAKYSEIKGGTLDSKEPIRELYTRLMKSDKAAVDAVVTVMCSIFATYWLGSCGAF